MRVAHQWPIVAVRPRTRRRRHHPGGQDRADEHGRRPCGRRSRGGPGGQGRIGDAVRGGGRRRRAPTRPPTSTATPTTGAASSRCSPAARCSPPRERERVAADPLVHRPPTAPRPGRPSRTSPGWRPASPARRSPPRRVTASGHLQGQARTDRPAVRRDRVVRGARRGGGPAGARRQGQGQAWQRHRRGKVDRVLRRKGPSSTRRGGHRPADHRQAGAVRTRRHPGRLRQAAGAVRGLPAAAVRARTRRGRRPRRRRRSTCPRPTRQPPNLRPPPPQARRPPDPRRLAPPPPPEDDALDLGATVLPILLKTYWRQALAVLVVIALIVVLIRC